MIIVLIVGMTMIEIIRKAHALNSGRITNALTFFDNGGVTNRSS